MFRRLFTPNWCRQVRAVHGVEVVAVGQVAARQLGSQVFADFVAQVGIPYCNRLPAHIVGVCLFSIICLVVLQ